MVKLKIQMSKLKVLSFSFEICVLRFKFYYYAGSKINKNFTY